MNLYNILIFTFVLITGIIFLCKKWFIFLNIKNEQFKKKKYIYQKIIIFSNLLAEIFPILLFIFTFRSFLYEPFQIPSASMMPTLLIGDFILVEKFSYNIKNPLTNNIILEINQPNYGDVVVFQYPKNKNLNYIKRIIGLPGDKIIYNEKTKEIKIQKICKNKKIKYCNKPIIKYINQKQSNFIEEIELSSNNNIKEYFWDLNIKKKKNKNNQYIILFEKEEVINNKKHKILFIPEFHNKKKKNIWIIPKDMYFVMGDYRDNSEDSRFWGFLNKNLLIGKAKFIWMSFEKQENNWPTNIRLKRIGKIY